MQVKVSEASGTVLDWACEECKPGSDIVKAGFLCSYHSALKAGQNLVKEFK